MNSSSISIFVGVFVGTPPLGTSSFDVHATAITEATRSDPDSNRRVLEHIPAGRWGEAGDLMGALVFLASRASDYVNGHVLSVDGGYLVR